ncbi:carboxynorspermidine decarboxylase [Pontiella sulfatireligans]|uniref:Carboxynorspermidine/carboxyspermidine decarboxylase n=1 Tax=Pontiella sulfatireligans TaxID=2750658 RepID=A0A6C2UKF1_9BACT|nr:carboxynorspermidine decarboxylase [Pontiella sulfatireligans]VGO19881.1 Carboxynorspermidine/carboxyspermidine decarboxylase [Pontiella sulfatireligans]
MKTPAFIVDEERIRRNCEVLASVKERTGCKILLALKGFAMWPLFPLIRGHLNGVCASSPWEARLGREEFGGEVHAYAAAYSATDFAELLTLCDEIDFNSFAQWQRFKVRAGSGTRPTKFGLRINPECSTQDPEHAIYDPCAPKSRLGIRRQDFEGQNLYGISGLHFHTLCEQNADDLETTLMSVEEQFGEFLPQMEWVNFGGGHHITRDDYDVDLLCKLINDFKAKYGAQVILEPGEAVALNAGVLVSTVLDVIDNDGAIAILDVSCTCHMPDVLEMPYRPEIDGVGLPGEKAHSYKLAGLSCLAGDVIGDYSFDEPLQAGDQLVFQDMAHYSMVKTSFFNGIQHPAIGILRNGEVETVREFSYKDYKRRLA